MTSVAILNSDGYESEEYDVKKHLISEFRKNGIEATEDTSTDAIQKSDFVILMYDTYKGITSDFETISKELINLNVEPIVLIVNAQNKGVSYVKIGENISKVWGDINPELYSNSAIIFFYENDTRIAYQVKTGEEEGISELIEIIEILKPKLKFFEEI